MKKLFLPLLALVCINVMAQDKPVAEFKLGDLINKIYWLQQSTTGTLVASTELGLVGISPTEQKIVWEIKDIGSPKEGSFDNIEGTPYFMVVSKSMLGKPQTSIVEAATGKVLFNSKEADIKVSRATPFAELNGLLLEGVREKKKFIALINFASGKETWSKDIAEVKGGFGIGALVRTIKSIVRSVFLKPPMLGSGNQIILVDGKEATCINGNDGTTLWKKEFDEKIEDALLTNEKDKLFISYEKRVDLITIADGKSAYGEKLLKIKGRCNGLSTYDKENYILYHENGVNIFSGATGELRWKKESDLDPIQDVRISDKGIIAISQDKEEAKIYLVDKDGKKVWKSEVKGVVQIVEPTEKGIIYFTSERGNLLSYDKGEDTWKRDIKLKERPFFGVDAPNKKIIVFSDEKLYVYDIAAGSISIINEKLKLKNFNEDKDVATIEARKQGYLISSNQSLALVDFTGKEIFNINFREAGASSLARFGMKALSVAASLYGSTSEIQSLRVTGSSTTPDGTTVIYVEPDKSTFAYQRADASYGVSNDLWAAASARYHATQAVKDYIYILTKFEDGVNGLVKVDKDSGKEVQRFPFDDKEPSYIIDEVEHRLYVVVKDKYVQLYNLK